MIAHGKIIAPILYDSQVKLEIGYCREITIAALGGKLAFIETDAPR